MLAGNLPSFPIYVDSPLAVNATEVFKMHPECYDTQARAFQKATGDILGYKSLTYIRDVEESKALHARKEPCTIISASGMCEAGRIRHHIKNNITNPRCTLLIPGFQAINTLGRKLADGATEITIFNDTLPVNAEVVQLHGFSGHADQAEMLRLLAPLEGQASHVFLVHGEPDQSEALAAKLRTRAFKDVRVAQRGETVEI